MNRLLSHPGLLPLPLPPPLSPALCRLRPYSLHRHRSTGLASKTGFIERTPAESLLYFDNVFPLKTAVYDLRYLVMRWDRRSVESRIRRQCLPPKLRDATAKATPPAFAITAVIPRYRDGGAFVKFVAPDPEATERAVSEFLREQRLKPWFSPSTRVRAFLVRGEPWLEDLHRCFPSTCLRVEFHQQKGAGGSGLPAMGPEALYALFRPYGRISDIAVNPGSKDGVPASAVIQFVRIRSATSARNCLHGLLATPPEMEAAKAGSKADRAARPDKAGGAERPGRAPREGAVLRITYERTTKTRWIGDWLAKHPRIVLPVLAAVLTATAVWVFDPIRTFFIRARITHSLHFADLGLTPYWGWLKATTVGRLPGLGSGPRGDGAEDPAALWDERKDAVERINSWLNECEETFIIVQGPRGSGKRELVMDSVLGGRKNVLLIDCKPINEAHGDSATIAAVASQVGYRPVFSWLNTLSSLVDLAAQGTIGASAGFSQTLENQFNKILQNTGVALKGVALAHKKDSERDAAMADDEYLAANPQCRPVVVIDNLLHLDGAASTGNNSNATVLHEKLADWAALLLSANVAHVIFLTNDSGFSKSLAKSLPGRVFRTIYLGDAQPEAAKRFVLHRLLDDAAAALRADEKLRAELDQSIEALGGRLTDLEFLARRIKAGETPAQAVQEMVAASAAEILKLYLFLDGWGAGGADAAKRRWGPEQAWHLVRQLAAADELRYNEVLLHDLFGSGGNSGGEEALQSLEQAELISVVSRNGRPWAIRPGKPIHRVAYRALLGDPVLRARMDWLVLKALCGRATDEIKKCEDELAVLAALDSKRSSTPRRVEWLVRRVEAGQKRIEDAEKEMATLKALLQRDF